MSFQIYKTTKIFVSCKLHTIVDTALPSMMVNNDIQ